MNPLSKILLLFLVTCFLAKSAQGQSLEKINDGTIITQSKVSFDGSKMVLVANYLGALKPYISTFEKELQEWSKPVPIFSGIASSDYTIRFPQLSVDNTNIFYAAKHKDSTHFDIYYSKLVGEKWSDPAPVAIGINTNEYDELAPSFSADQSRLLFTRSFPIEEKAEEYCYELYLTELSENGKWLPAEPLGPAFNSGCVSSPYFAKDNKTFFFTSFQDVEDSEGKKISRNQLNIFWAKIDGLFEYKPKPIIQIAGDQDVSSFSVAPDGTFYYSAGKLSRGETKLESKIYSEKLDSAFSPVKMLYLTGFVKDKSDSPLSATIQVIDPFTTKIFQEIETASDGSFQFYLPLNRQFSILARKENYSTQSQLIESVGDEKTIEFNLFSSVSLSYNVFDADFYFPLQASASLYDSAFVPIENLSSQSAESIQVPLGKELNVIISTENYFSDTINLPFDKQVIFDAFEFDVELTRIVKEVSLTFEDEDGNNLGLEITVFNVTRNEKTTRYVKDGKIDLELRDGEVYEISTSAKGYSYYNKEIDLSKDDETEVNVELKSIEDVSLVLNNIIFATNSYELNASSYIELDNLIAYLSANEQYNVEIAAFTDDLGPEDYNLKLSNLRAVSVLEYLQDNSVSKDRLFAEGFGEDNPIVPNDTEDNRALNRRVEFKIVDAE